MKIKINSDGMIVGGVCDMAHHQRASREIGARLYLELLRDKGCISENKGWLRIIKLPKIIQREIYKIGSQYGANVEIGYRRFKTDIVETLHEQNRSFRKRWLEKWAEDICSFEFGVGGDTDNPLAILGAFSGNKKACCFGYAEPPQDDLYKKRKARGDFIK